MTPFWMALAGLYGAVGVALGAFGAHGLRGRVTPERLAVWHTATEYHLLHAAVLLGLALWLLARGQVVPGLAAGVVAAGLGLSGWMQAKVAAVPMDELEARRLLGVGLNADEDEILAAHRRLIAKVHPDRGGNPEMARRVNAARDYLIVNRARRG